jgi:predicted dehydrogenase
MNQISRRQFFEDSLFAAAAAAAAASASQTVLAADEKKVSSLERLRFAVIGCRGRGGNHIDALVANKDAELVAVCDVDPAAYAKNEKRFAKMGRKPDYVQDLRKLLERKDIDCVTIATPNHWHSLAAIWAMQAGKDVYVEKPVSHNVSEGRRMVEVARKLGRICQGGMQSRSNPGMRSIIEFAQSGKLGKITISKGFCYKPRGSIGKATAEPQQPPKGMDFDLWCGPAPYKLPTRLTGYGPVHYDWHWFWDYGNGDLGNQGIHEMDKARWGLGKSTLPTKIYSVGGRFGYEDCGETANTQLCYFDWDDGSQLIFEVRGLPTIEFYKGSLPRNARGDRNGAKVGNMWIGTKGYAVSVNYQSGTAFDLDGKQIAHFEGGSDGLHYANFIKAVRSRNIKDQNADIEDGHLSSALCHLGNVSYRMGSLQPLSAKPSEIGLSKEREATYAGFLEHLKANKVDLDKTKVRSGCEVVFDPKTEKTTCDGCNQLLTREYRKGFEVPAKV